MSPFIHRLLTTVLMLSASSAFAQETAEQIEKAQPPEKPKPAITIDDVQSQASETMEVVEETIQKMRDVMARVSRKDTGSRTQTMQKDILSNLDSLIEQAQKQQQQRQQDKQKQQQQQQKQRSQQQQQKNQPQQGQQQQSQQGKQPKPDGRRKDDGQDNSKKTEERAAAAAQMAERKVVLQQVWGHLPERLRERVLNMSDDKYLPKYESLIRKYFEALAEKRSTKP